MPKFINYNGKLLEEGIPIVEAASRGLRYGDGLFETMKMVDGKILLEDYHFERLFKGLELLQFKIPVHFTPAFLSQQVLALCTKNRPQRCMRIRLNVFRKNGGLYDLLNHIPDFVIETWELPESYFRLNENGLVIGIYPEARKSCDSFANIKSNNYLPYAMGALYAQQNKLNDCLLVNTHERICDATISNVFWIKDQMVYTTPLSEGCVAGVMRRHLMKLLPQQGYTMQEKPLEPAELKQADELFLTNATSGIRWVREFQGSSYTNNITARIYSQLS